MNKNSERSRRKAAFAAALVFISNYCCAFPLSDISRTSNVYAADTTDEENPTVTSISATSNTSLTSTKETTGTKSTTASTGTTTKKTTTTTQPTSDIYYVTVENANNSVEEMKKIGNKIFTYGVEDLSVDKSGKLTVTVKHGTSINENDIFYDRLCYRLAKNDGKGNLVYDLYYQVSGLEEKDEVKIADYASDGYYKKDTEIKLTPTDCYVINGKNDAGYKHC